MTPAIYVNAQGQGSSRHYVPLIVWKGCNITPAQDRYTSRAHALRGARRALRRLGYRDLFTDIDK